MARIGGEAAVLRPALLRSQGRRAVPVASRLELPRWIESGHPDMRLGATPRDVEAGHHISSDAILELIVGNAPEFGENRLPILASIDL
jgi:hypothetical protein